jgi:hypothetical protein
MNNMFCDHGFDHRLVANATELARQVALRVPQTPLPGLASFTPITIMTSIGTGYDLSASTYSPDGRIFQVLDI